METRNLSLIEMETGMCERSQYRLTGLSGETQVQLSESVNFRILLYRFRVKDRPPLFLVNCSIASWLNLIESFFGKMAKNLLRSIRVASADELKTRDQRNVSGLPLEIQI